MNGLRILRALVATSIVALVAASAFGAYELARPGCSPFPVAVPTYDPDHGAVGKASPSEVCAILGRPMPQITYLPSGVHRDGIGWAPLPFARPGVGIVSVGYTRDRHGVATLDVTRQDAIPVGNQRKINGTVQGVPAIVTTLPRTAPPGTVGFASYMWSKDGLLYELHVRIADGIDPNMAAAMAESVR